MPVLVCKATVFVLIAIPISGRAEDILNPWHYLQSASESKSETASVPAPELKPIRKVPEKKVAVSER